MKGVEHVDTGLALNLRPACKAEGIIIVTLSTNIHSIEEIGDILYGTSLGMLAVLLYDIPSSVSKSSGRTQDMMPYQESTKMLLHEPIMIPARQLDTILCLLTRSPETKPAQGMRMIMSSPYGMLTLPGDPIKIPDSRLILFIQLYRFSDFL